MPLTPIFDELAKLDGSPGLHALIIGVSEYPYLNEAGEKGSDEHLGLVKLTSAALAGYRIYQWLLSRKEHLPVPLARCWLLLAPSPKEIEAEPALSSIHAAPTLDNVQKAAALWRQDLKAHKGSIGWFYFAGHGVQRRRRDHVMLLQEFGESPDPKLRHAIETSNLIDGLAPSEDYPDMARTQLYFLDACRISSRAFSKYETNHASVLWDVPVLNRVRDDRSKLIAYTTVEGDRAFGLKGRQTIFSTALIECLENAAAEPLDCARTKWAVSDQSLLRQLQAQIDVINQRYGSDQNVVIESVGPRKLLLNRLEGPPLVNLELQVLPSAALDCAQVSVLNCYEESVFNLAAPVTPHPFTSQLPGGLYRVTAQMSTQGNKWMPYTQLLDASPPRAVWDLEIEPKEGGTEADD